MATTTTTHPSVEDLAEMAPGITERQQAKVDVKYRNANAEKGHKDDVFVSAHLLADDGEPTDEAPFKNDEPVLGQGQLVYITTHPNYFGLAEAREVTIRRMFSKAGRLEGTSTDPTKDEIKHLLPSEIAKQEKAAAKEQARVERETARAAAKAEKEANAASGATGKASGNKGGGPGPKGAAKASKPSGDDE
jgi:hypothetical protein